MPQTSESVTITGDDNVSCAMLPSQLANSSNRLEAS